MRILLIHILLLSVGLLNGQDIIGVVGRGFYHNDKIRLRWMPKDIISWKVIQENGVRVLRKNLSQGNVDTLENNFRPLSQSEWLKDLNEEDSMEMAAYGVYYGEFDIKEKIDGFSLDALENRQLLADNRYAIHILAGNHSWNAALKMAQAYEDVTVDDGAFYLYSIQVLDRFGAVESSEEILMQAIPKTLPNVDKIEALWGDMEVKLAWDDYHMADHYVSYNVERQENNSHWQQVNTVPIVRASYDGGNRVVVFVDSLVDNNVEYSYRVLGNTAFGVMGPPSKSVKGKGQALMNISPPFISMVQEEAEKIVIIWSIDSLSIPFILETNVWRSENYEGPFTKINMEGVPPEVNFYIDIHPLSSAYYKIEMTDVNGRKVTSPPRLIHSTDVTPPVTPSGLICALDSTLNSVMLKWDENKEDDLAGYRLFYGYKKEGEFFDVPGNDIKSPQYRWEMDVYQPYREIYFAVEAFDLRMNRSRKSALCSLTFYDDQPPSPPLIRKRIPRKGAIVFEWGSSASLDIDHHIIERGDARNWQEIHRENTLQPVYIYIDSAELIGGRSYNYRIKAVDKTGKFSYSEAKVFRAYLEKLAPEILGFEVVKEEEGFLLRWKYLTPETVSEVEIYRQSKDGKASIIKVLREDDLVKYSLRFGNASAQYQWPVKELKGNYQHKYAVRIRLQNGLVSPITQWD